MPRPTKTPTATKVVFVRHGRTPTTGKVLPGRAKGLHLSEEGSSQAAAAGLWISGSHEVSAIYNSPLERARETAAPIAKATGVKAVTNKALLECDFGDWTGWELKKLVKLPEWQSLLKAPDRFRFPNGESFLEMQARVLSGVQALVEEHRGQTVVAVSHADPIKMVLIAALGTSLDAMHRMEVSPCSVSVVRYEPASTTVVSVNSTDHLEMSK